MPDENNTVSDGDMNAIIADLRSQIEGVANAVAELSQRAATTDEIRNSTEPLSDAIASLSATFANLPAGTVAELSADDKKRNAWVDKILHKWFSGDMPADEPSA